MIADKKTVTLTHQLRKRHCDNHIECHTADIVYNLYEGAGGHGRVNVYAFEYEWYEGAEPRCKEYYHKKAQRYRKGYNVGGPLLIFF